MISQKNNEKHSNSEDDLYKVDKRSYAQKEVSALRALLGVKPDCDEQSQINNAKQFPGHLKKRVER